MSSADSKQRLYRVAFFNQGEVYEVFARSVSQGALFGFVEIEKLVFGERSSVVIDPAEEKLANEFADVERSYIPMHSVIRIDEVTRRGTAKVTPADSDSKVRPFPVYTRQGPGGGGQGNR
ncbi:hypothetical protein SSPSH_003211 [Salinisphaera shabanensis E1L3A]|jgi:hypothetical protein|uniref:DUF1820 family protein n=1 Tax=Salinisphaera shabanensis E1L3A TaxID=1033802 RepID=U2EI00_9GAMM|nr:DUF1820 family protein [Salinisphaera shabanensis]ERJ17992.1 hypothetical protein SSPSH_003211 [Salinisphaera shabanensis E1L3A]